MKDVWRSSSRPPRPSSLGRNGAACSFTLFLQDVLSEVHERLLVGFILLSMDHEEFKRVTMNKSVPSTQVLIQSVQRQVHTLFERIDTYMMQVLQDWKTFRWSRITLLSDPAAKLMRMKVHVFSDSTLCVGISNLDPSNHWATTIGGRMERARI